MRRLRRVLLGVAAAALIVVIGLGALVATWLAGVRLPGAAGAPEIRVIKVPSQSGASRAAGGPDAPFFVLLVGNDFRPGVSGARGDALHIVGVNPKRNQASMINIPRDTCWDGDKINAANTRGPRAQADAVGGLVGVPVDYVVEVDFAGFMALVDGVGGVDVNVPVEMSDSYTGAYFPAGRMRMNGGQALAFARNRRDFPDSDISRTYNQGLLILDGLRELKRTQNNALGEFRLLTLLGRHARVDGIGLTELLRLSRTAFALNPDTIDNVTIPYTGGGCLELGAGASELFADFRADGIIGS